MNQPSPVIDAAERVGQGDPRDWSLRPAGLAALFREAEPAFAQFLGHSRQSEVARRYEESDARAVEAQAEFKRQSQRASWGILVAAVCGALLASSTVLASLEVQPNLHRVAVGVLTLLSLVSVFVGFVALNMLENEGLLASWMTSRAEAESARIAYFNTLVERAVAADARTQLLALELFRRYQFGVQRAYYTGRQAEHRASQRRTARLSSVALAILTVGAGAGVFAGLTELKWLSLTAVGAIGAALAAFASRRADLTQDSRNSERYLRTAQALGRVGESLSDVREGVAAGRVELLSKFVDAVHEQISLEHRQWVEQGSALDAAARDLHAALRPKE